MHVHLLKANCLGVVGQTLPVLRYNETIGSPEPDPSRRIQGVFAAHDAAGRGVLALGTFHRCLRSLGSAVDHHEAVALVAPVVASIGFSTANGTEPMATGPAGQAVVSYRAFAAAMLTAEAIAYERGAIAATFRALDVDGDGTISAADLVAASCGRVSSAVAEEMIYETAGGGSTGVVLPVFEGLLRAE